MKYLVVFFMLISYKAYAGEAHLGGNVNNITSIREGLLIALDTGKPSGCTQTSAWMLIPEENKTMISVALAMHMSGKTKATIYVDVNASGSYCVIAQYDPHP